MLTMKSIFSAFSPQRKKPRVYIDASTFDPCQPRQGEAVILFARNEADSIYERVRAALRCAAGVVVIDLASADGTPYFAAEAGAVVVMQQAGQSREASLAEAMKLARRINANVRVCDEPRPNS